RNMNTKITEKGNGLKNKDLLELAADIDTVGDLDELLTVAVSRKELKTLCEKLMAIGDVVTWIRLCLSVRLEYLTDDGNKWNEMNLYSIAYNDAYFGESVTIRLLRGDLLFLGVCFLAGSGAYQVQLSEEAATECVELFRSAGWLPAVSYLNRE